MGMSRGCVGGKVAGPESCGQERLISDIALLVDGSANWILVLIARFNSAVAGRLRE